MSPKTKTSLTSYHRTEDRKTPETSTERDTNGTCNSLKECVQMSGELLTSLETSNVGRHRMTVSIKMLGTITASFSISYQSTKMYQRAQRRAVHG